MVQNSGGHSGHGSDSSKSLAPASPWPWVAATAVLILGLSLFWAASEDSEEATIPVVVAAAALLVVSAVAWLIESGAFRQAEADSEPRAVRQTQVITFAIAEGQLESARGPEGVLTALESSEGNLRSHPGFEDLRVTISSAEGGPSQGLVETTWSNREALAGYDGAKETLLDLINGAGDQVMVGSVQAFDMDVVRDTKESPIRFSFFSWVVALCALVVGGFAVAIVVGVTDDNPAVAAATDDRNSGTDGSDPFAVISIDLEFDKATLRAAPNVEVTYTLTNDGDIVHNLSFYEEEGGAEIAIGEIIPSDATTTVTFTTPGPGTYFFRCDLHPTQMTGVFEVVEGGPGAGGNGGVVATAEPAESFSIVSIDNEFDRDTLFAPPNTEVTFTLVNDGDIVHNLSFYEEEGGAKIAIGEIIPGDTTTTVTFTTPGPGTYFFRCDVHPVDMIGVFEVSADAS